VVIVLTPQGRGTHVELGIALALGKKVFIWHENDKYFKCTDDTSSFYWLSNVKRLNGTIEDLIRIVTTK
jgi:nucleoside 2-deoxyribosyltransferase